MSFINWGHETPEQKEIRKRIEEDMMNQLISKKIFEARGATSASAAAGVGSGKPKNPKSIVAFAPVIFHAGFLQENGHVGITVAKTTDTSNFAFSEILDLGEETVDTDYLYFRLLHNGGTILIGGRYSDYYNWAAFVDAGGNLLEFIPWKDNLSTFSSDGKAVGLSFQVRETVTKFYWWMGEEVFSRSIENSIQDVSTGEFNWDTSSDGTLNVSVYDGSQTRVFLARPNGNLIDITDLLEDAGNYHHSSRNHPTSNCIPLFFEDENGYFYKLRVIQLDGTFADYSLTEISDADGLNSFSYGTSKFGFMLTNGSSESVIYAYDNLARTLAVSNVIDRSVYPFWDSYYSRLDPTENYFNSLNGFENLMFLFYSNSTYDGKMDRYTAFTTITLFGGETEFVEWSPSLAEGETFGFETANIENTCPQLVINASESTTSVDLLTLRKDAAPVYEDIMAYADYAGINLMVCGDVTILVLNTGSYLVVNGETGSTELAVNGIIPAQYDVNWNTFWLSDIDNGTLHFYCPTGGDSVAGTVTKVIHDSYFWNNNSSSAQWKDINGHTAGVTYFEFDDNTARLLSPAGMSEAFEYSIGYVRLYVSANMVMHIWQNTNWFIDVYDIYGARLNSIDTGYPIEDVVSYRLVSDRFFMVSGDATSYLTVTPDGTPYYLSDENFVRDYSMPNDYTFYNWC
jgi:hypothetical protein